MAERTKTITVVAVTDNHYMVLLAALLKSIEANIAADTKMDLWIVEDGVTKVNKGKLEKSRDAAVTSLHWKSVREVIPAGTKLPLDQSSWPLNIYMRLFIPYFIPEGVEKVLYLDVDMIVLKDLGALMQTDLKNNTIAAVLDPNVRTFDNSWGGVLNYQSLGFPGDTAYFNTGLLLIDLPKWRANNTTEKILDCIHQNRKFANFPDQYGLNIVLANKWLHLDTRWNHFATIDADAPFIIHFVQRKPIYKTYSNNVAYKDLFYHYLKLTEWRNVKPIGESKRYFKKVRNILNKVLKRK